MLLSVQDNVRDAGVSLTEECGPVIRRNGDLNVSMVNVTKQRSRYMMDLYTTIVDAQWRYTLFIFISGFVLSWLFFGFIWYVIIRVHGDDLPQADEEGYVPCVLNVRTFAAAYLFSLETQHTIGYGVRAITEECPMAVCMLSLQSITGVILQAFMAGVVFAKLTRSKARANTLLFSRRAVVCQRDSHFVLMFRVADLRKSLIVGASVQAQLIRPKRTLEGEYLPFHMTKVNVGGDDHSNDLLFIWPVTVVHVIDETSPFYDMDASAMLNERFELVVYLEGTSESTGTTMQARYSYHNGDVMWGNRFQQCVRFDESSVDYVIDFDKFEKTTSVGTPLLSPRDWDLVMKRTDNCTKHPLLGGDQLVMFNANHFKESCLQDCQSCSTHHSTACRSSQPSIEYLIEHPITTDDLSEEPRQNGYPSFVYHSNGYQSVKRRDKSVNETEDDTTQELGSGNVTTVSNG